MPADGLREQAQPDFSAGAFQGVERSLIPPTGFYAGSNVLLDSDGAAYKRGGSVLLSTADFGSSGLPATFLLDAYLSAGRRTVFADPSAFGVLDANEAPITLGGAGLSTPKKAAIIGGVAVIGGGTMYAGSFKTANYTTGTVSTTLGSKVVTGAGTTWNTLVDAGMFLRIGSERYYVVASVDSTTQITLTEAYEGTTAAGKAYTLSPLATAPRTSDFYVTGFDRLISLEGNRAYESRQPSAGASGMPPAGNSQWQTFDALAYVELPGGVQITGGYFLGETLYVFTTSGVYAVSNIAYDITDDAGNDQQAVTRVSPDLALWGNEGIASFGSQMIVPATDGVWLISGGAQEKLSLSIDARYINHVLLGRKPGLATVFRSHYMLPILSGANDVVEILTCRLDRPQRTRLGVVYPWTWQTGLGANATALAVRVGSSPRSPRLLGLGRRSAPSALQTAPATPGAAKSSTAGTLTSGQAYYYRLSAITASGESDASIELGPLRVGPPAGVSAFLNNSAAGRGLPAGTYYFKVTALAAGGETLASSEVSVTVPALPNKSVTILWSPVVGAGSYRVYRGTAAGAENLYAVPALTGRLDWDNSTPTTAGTPPGSNTFGQNSITFSWAAYPGATGYRLYRGTAAGAETVFFAPGNVTTFTDTGGAGTAGTPAVATIPTRILDLSGFFAPTAAIKTDHDSTNFEYDLTTRDLTPDRLNVEALVKRLRLRYQMDDAAADDPRLTAWYSIGTAATGQATWGDATWGDATWGETGASDEVQLATQATVDDGRHPKNWPVNVRTRAVRFRFRSADPVAKLVLRNFEVFSRPSGKA